MASNIITLAQQKGGSGKTTLAVNLAVAFAAMGARVALIDTDPQGSLGHWFQTRSERLPDGPGLQLAKASASGVAYECSRLRGAADIIIIDTPPRIDADLRPALREADLILVPVASSHVDLWATRGVIDLAARENKTVRIVLNRARTGTRLGAEVAAAATDLDAELVAATLANRIGYAEALGLGLGAMELQRTGAAATEIRTLVEEVLGLLANETGQWHQQARPA